MRKTEKTIFNDFTMAKETYRKIKAMNLFPIFLNRSYPIETSVVLACLQASSNLIISKITGIDSVESEIESMNIYIKPYYNKNSFAVAGQQGNWKELQDYLKSKGHKTDLSYLESMESTFKADLMRIQGIIS